MGVFSSACLTRVLLAAGAVFYAWVAPLVDAGPVSVCGDKYNVFSGVSVFFCLADILDRGYLVIRVIVNLLLFRCGSGSGFGKRDQIWKARARVDWLVEELEQHIHVIGQTLDNLSGDEVPHGCKLPTIHRCLVPLPPQAVHVVVHIQDAEDFLSCSVLHAVQVRSCPKVVCFLAIVCGHVSEDVGKHLVLVVFVITRTRDLRKFRCEYV